MLAGCLFVKLDSFTSHTRNYMEANHIGCIVQEMDFGVYPLRLYMTSSFVYV